MHLLVTGGAGFIGSAFIRLVAAEQPNWRITNFDALTYAGNLDNLQGLDDRFHRFIRGDIADRDAVRAALTLAPDGGTDAIINFAAESHVDRSIENPDAFLRTNVLGTQVLLDAARAAGVRRFLQVSTDEVLGSLAEDDNASFVEDSPYAPNNPYAASKAAAEHLVRVARHTFGLDAVITRSGNNFGPRQFPEKLIPLLIANALADQPIPLYGDGRQVRDWIYVDDHCRALLAVLTQGKARPLYHIGARNQRCNLDIAQSILCLLAKSTSLIRFVKDRPGHDRRYAIDPAKIEIELGWSPRETWESGLLKTVQWYQENVVWLARARSGAYRDFYIRQYGSDPR
jgi:dTDP-glucose 4,6-dehydratase